MSNLVLHPTFELYERKDRAFCSSLQVAETFEKQHGHILRDIEEINQSKNGEIENFFLLNFERVKYTDTRGRRQPMYLLTRDGFMVLSMGFTGEKALRLKIAYTQRFNNMEQFIRDYIHTRDEFPAFCQAIEDAYDEPKSYHYINECNLININRVALGMDAKTFKELHNLGNVRSIRPFLSEEQARAVRQLQTWDIRLLYKGFDYPERKAELTGLFNEKFPALSSGFERAALLG